jgi:hypothetical protein
LSPASHATLVEESPHCDGTPPPPQMAGEVHVPHEAIVPPQPLGQGPQFTPDGQVVIGTQMG